jgi:hypothetical protein
MSLGLHPDLRRVAKLRQVTIKTARDWRDSENQKWFKALGELEELRRKNGFDILAPIIADALADLKELEVETEVMQREEIDFSFSK